MTSHTFECTYQLTGSEFATLHEELKKFGSYYFENRPKMAYENKKTDKQMAWPAAFKSTHATLPPSWKGSML